MHMHYVCMHVYMPQGRAARRGGRLPLPPVPPLAPLAPQVTEQDAHDAVEIVKETILYNTLADLMGGLGAPNQGPPPATTTHGRPGVLGGGNPGPGLTVGGAKVKVPMGRVVKEFVARLEHEAHEQAAHISCPEMMSRDDVPR